MAGSFEKASNRVMGNNLVARFSFGDQMKIEPFEFIVAALATYRISLLFSKESGPAKVFAKLRRAPKKGSATEEWLSCIFCFSMTASAVVCGCLWLAGTRQHWAEWFLVWCALSAVAIALNQTLTKGPL